jgi:hydrogenase maturation protein HypF
MTPQARKLILTGRVQGVGYRPFVYNRALELGLAGTVYNGSGKVFVRAEGDPARLDQLEHDLVNAAPPLARPQLASSETAELEGLSGFSILASDASTEAEIHVPPDLFTCDDCLAELSGPEERRNGYPFINCTQCGPRYTIITAMPYDRPNTSMAAFPLCDDCRAEYENPADRRFHAQPLACPVCGPQLEFVSIVETAKKTGSGSSNLTPAPKNRAGFNKQVIEPGPAFSPPNPLLQAIEALESGQILAIKGVGGYHLVCDAANDEAIQALRERKRRPHKPLAVMFPLEGEDGLDTVREHLELDEVTAEALTDPTRPIVLVKKCGSDLKTGVRFGEPDPLVSAPFSTPAAALSPHLAPGLRELGAFLPYSPLHHELLRQFGRPIVATSGNVSGEPVITDNEESQKRLANVADGFLHHDRPIVRPADDPVIRPMAGKARVIRLGRGIAPLERQLPRELAKPVLATGGHMKNTVALAWADRVVISPHIGDLDSPRSNDIFIKIINNIQIIYDVESHIIACDLHPGYSSTRWAEKQGLPLVRIQHHAAHASSLAGEYPEVEKWLVFTWDGVGYGSDGSLWGGEALAGAPGNWSRVASFRPFKLVGGDKAGREPWRSAAAMWWASDKQLPPSVRISRNENPSSSRNSRSDNLSSSRNSRSECPGSPPSKEALTLAHQAWQQNINTYQSSAAGRIFDAAAALVLGRNIASFEGQGPMELEQAAVAGCDAIPLPLARDE